MLNPQEGNGVGSRRFPYEFWSERRPPTSASGCQRILVPTSLTNADTAALRRAFELAASQRAKLTVLHVAPPDQFQQDAAGLCAIGLLHDAAHALNVLAEMKCRPASAAENIQRIQEFLAGVVPPSLRELVEFRIECRRGEVAETIAQVADAIDADLVVLSRRPPRWWLPILPADVRRVLQLTSRQAMLVPQDKPPSKSA